MATDLELTDAQIAEVLGATVAKKLAAAKATGIGIAKAEADAAKKEGVAPATSTPAPLTLPIEVTFERGRPLVVVLVGAGGTGARLGPDIARLLSRDDKLVVVDHDTVEEHNLLRQHFVRGDIGKYKAEVVARRAQLSATAGVDVQAQVLKLENLGTFLSSLTDRRTGAGPANVLFVGAVDTRACRAVAAAYIRAVTTTNVVWLDAGNELRGGQVGIMASARAAVSNPMAGVSYPPKGEVAEQLWQAHHRHEGYNRGDVEKMLIPRVHINTLAEQTPAILKPDPKAEAATEGCALRIDGQSLAANVMAYACLINLISRVVDGLPISMGMSFFSTSNTMSGKPFLSLAGQGPEKLNNSLVVSTLPSMPPGSAGHSAFHSRVQKALMEGA